MDEKTQRILQANNIDKIMFYTVDSPLVNNLFTACVFINTRLGRIEARGVAICSLLDSYSKKKGKQKALGRALSALVHQKNTMKIRSYARQDEYINRRVKLRDEEEKYSFIHDVSTELSYLGDYDFNVKFIKNVGDKYMKCSFNMPLNYPIKAAHEYFKYKSQYLPEPANQEEQAMIDKFAIFSEPIKDEKSSQFEDQYDF